MITSAQPRLPMAVLLSMSLCAIGVSYASTMPYDAVVAIDHLGISHAHYALILTVAAIVGLIASVALGWLSDHIGDRRLLILATAIIGAAGFGVIYVVRTPLAFAAITCLIIPFGNAAFSQTFAYARVYYDQHRPGDAEFRVTLLRSIYAASWVIVPPLAGFIAAVYNVFDIYLLAAVAYLICGAIALLMLADPATRLVAKPPARVERGTGYIALPMLIGIGGVLLINVAVRLSGTVTPLAMVSNFGGNIGDVGISNGIRAALEIPLMIGWGLLGRRIRKHTLIAAAALVYALYLWLMAQAHTVIDVYWLQVPAAIAIAALMSIPISYLQEAIRGRVGLSTSLLDITLVIAGLLSAGLFGIFAGPANYITLFWISAVLSALGALTLVVAHGAIERRAAQ